MFLYFWPALFYLIHKAYWDLEQNMRKYSDFSFYLFLSGLKLTSVCHIWYFIKGPNWEALKRSSFFWLIKIREFIEHFFASIYEARDSNQNSIERAWLRGNHLSTLGLRHYVDPPCPNDTNFIQQFFCLSLSAYFNLILTPFLAKSVYN